MEYTITKGNNSKQSTFKELLQESEYTLLYFYPKNDTPWCTLEAQDFTKLTNDFSKKWIHIVWVSKDDTTSHCSFIEKYSLTPSYLADPGLSLHKEFSTRWEKKNWGKIVMWVIRSTFLLDKGWTIINEWRSIKATWHADRVWKWVESNL